VSKGFAKNSQFPEILRRASPGIVRGPFSTKSSWSKIRAELTPEELELVNAHTVFPALPFVHRAVFMAVPHKGSGMAQMSIARFGARIVSLPKDLRDKTPVFLRIFLKLRKDDEVEVRKLRRIGEMEERVHEIFTGLNDLDPDSPFIRVSAAPRSRRGSFFIRSSATGNGPTVPAAATGWCRTPAAILTGRRAN